MSIVEGRGEWDVEETGKDTAGERRTMPPLPCDACERRPVGADPGQYGVLREPSSPPVTALRVCWKPERTAILTRSHVPAP